MKISIGLATLLVIGATSGPVSAQSAAPAPERFVLSGLILFGGEEGLAFLQEPSLTQNQVVPLRRGDSIGPWKLARLRDNSVEMEGPSGTILIPLQGGPGGGPAVAGAPPGAVTAPLPAPANQRPFDRPSPAPVGAAASAPATGAAAAPAGTPTPGFVWDTDPAAQHRIRAQQRTSPGSAGSGPATTAAPSTAGAPAASSASSGSPETASPAAPANTQAVRPSTRAFQELFGVK